MADLSPVAVDPLRARLARRGHGPPTRLILAELKTDRGKVTPHQAEWLELLGACPGVETYLWRPADFDTIAEVLK
jgi:hypothetical protein